MGKIDVSTYPKVTVILRGYTYEQIRCVVRQLVGTRLSAVETAMNTPGAADIIARIADEFGDELLIGAGTVISEEKARQAVRAGARFALSPICFTSQIFDICKEAGVACIPAACSPTEVWQMFQMGADIVKIYPASILGPEYFTAIQAPLNPMPLMAVGGVDADNCQTFLDAGATYVGIGSGIFRPEDILSENGAALKASIEQFEKKVRW